MPSKTASNRHPTARLGGGRRDQLRDLHAETIKVLREAGRYLWEVSTETVDGVRTLRDELPEADLWRRIMKSIDRLEELDRGTS